MRGGGTIVDGVWLARAAMLRPGDEVRCLNWNGEWWCGGEVLIVLGVRYPTPRDGFMLFDICARDCRGETRTLAVRPLDQVTIVERELPQEKPAKAARPVAGEQLRLL